MAAKTMARADRSADFRWRSSLAIAFALSFHLAILLWLSGAVAPQRSSSRLMGSEQSVSLQVHLLAVPRRSAEMPVRPMPALKRPVRPDRPASMPRANASQQELPVTAHAATSSVQLFNSDGSIRMPTSTAANVAPRDANVANMRSFAVVYCHHSRYAQDYARGQDEDLGAQVARKYLRWIGMYNPVTEAGYQERRAAHEQACSH